MQSNLSRYLQDQSGVQHQSGFVQILSENFWAMALIVILALIVLILGVCFLREYCWRKCGIEVCPGAAGSYRERQQRELAQQMEEEDRQRALEVERQWREERTQERRKERRAKYEVYLEKYSMTVKPEDLCRPVSDCSSPPDVENQIAQEAPISNDDLDIAASSSLNDDQIMLTLPATTFNRPRRQVESTCAICIGQYEHGDKVVWSSRNECVHAFHDDCILTWLSKGKKRCPVCRFFFVPGRAVDGVKEIVDDEDSSHEREETADGGNEQGDAQEEAESEESIIEALRANRHASDHVRLEGIAGTNPEEPA